MNRDARNDVFLSALDLFMLLLFAFIGVHFEGVAGKKEQKATVALPLMGPHGHPSPLVAADKVLWLRWANAADRKGGPKDRCHVQIVEAGKAEVDQVPCWPGAFGGEGGVGPRFAALGRIRRRAVVECPRSEADLPACARLAWLSVENGIDATVGIDEIKERP